MEAHLRPLLIALLGMAYRNRSKAFGQDRRNTQATRPPGFFTEPTRKKHRRSALSIDLPPSTRLDFIAATPHFGGVYLLC